MTYIKWKDEVESYLGNLSASEKQKVFSYFAEMYADKRDAGISEETIIEGFGAPYDVAQRILADSKETPSSQPDNQNGAVNGSGGNNYNYNYYNYNYGGAPAGFNGAPTGFNERTESANGQNGANNGESAFGKGYSRTNPDDVDVSDIDMPLPEGTPKPKVKGERKQNPFVTFLLLVLLAIPIIVVFWTGIGLTIGFFSAAVGCIVSGCMTMGEGVSGLVSGLGQSQISVLGSGFIQFGAGLLLIPVSVFVVKFVWKVVLWVFRQLKSLITA